MTERVSCKKNNKNYAVRYYKSKRYYGNDDYYQIQIYTAKEKTLRTLTTLKGENNIKKLQKEVVNFLKNNTLEDYLETSKNYYREKHSNSNINFANGLYKLEIIVDNKHYLVDSSKDLEMLKKERDEMYEKRNILSREEFIKYLEEKVEIRDKKFKKNVKLKLMFPEKPFENSCNRTGVCWSPAIQKYVAHITYNRKTYQLLKTISLEKAIKARELAENAIKDYGFEGLEKYLRKLGYTL